MNNEFIIDVCVAVYAGKAGRVSSKSKHQLWIYSECQSFLWAMPSAAATVRFTKEILTEWNKVLARYDSSQSAVAWDWLKEMQDNRLVVPIDECSDAALRSCIGSCPSCSGKKNPVEDVPLLEAAHASGAIVVSSDHKACGRFKAVAAFLAKQPGTRVYSSLISATVWMNPCCPAGLAKKALHGNSATVRSFALTKSNPCCS